MDDNQRVFELRTYDAVPGKIDALLTRFREHAAALFEKHGMTNIGFWVASDDEGKPTETLVYLVAHESREAAKKSWEAFWADPEWLAARSDGEQVTASASSMFLDPTGFSELR
ncbi:NIPSNAP family protein [Nocardia africana]|uniref:NIPSNAP n=1 Tax=Nocardia africana TaxID=134964 RepID=A0A378X0X2_9NOCA|nr:NIPSNAP family protein [Nocardia africana]MCC3312365.1 NIPSNAP family protein [Nocardia africana]SUA46324.1 NIPSNAP [Nocardia africana]